MRINWILAVEDLEITYIPLAKGNSIKTIKISWILAGKVSEVEAKKGKDKGQRTKQLKNEAGFQKRSVKSRGKKMKKEIP